MFVQLNLDTSSLADEAMCSYARVVQGCIELLYPYPSSRMLIITKPATMLRSEVGVRVHFAFVLVDKRRARHIRQLVARELGRVVDAKFVLPNKPLVEDVFRSDTLVLPMPGTDSVPWMVVSKTGEASAASLGYVSGEPMGDRDKALDQLEAHNEVAKFFRLIQWTSLYGANVGSKGPAFLDVEERRYYQGASMSDKQVPPRHMWFDVARVESSACPSHHTPSFSHGPPSIKRAPPFTRRLAAACTNR